MKSKRRRHRQHNDPSSPFQSNSCLCFPFHSLPDIVNDICTYDASFCMGPPTNMLALLFAARV